jgi:hypothetical protein
MSLEYSARAVGIGDGENGRKIVVFRTVCGRTVKVECDPNQADFVVRDLTPVEAPCA